MCPTEPPYTPPLTGLTKIKIKKVEGVLYPGGAPGYFLGGYVAPGTPNWQPVLNKFPLKLISRSRICPKTDTPF